MTDTALEAVLRRDWRTQSGGHVPGTGGTRSRAGPGDGSSARSRLRRRRIGHGDARTADPTRSHDGAVAGPARLYARACPRGVLALEIRHQTQRFIVVNNGHRDFVFASGSRSLKLRYLVPLYAKELVMHNFAGLSADQLLERMVELSLRTEEHRHALEGAALVAAPF
jgi:hypothetical protein